MSQKQKDQVRTLREKFHPKDTSKWNTADLIKHLKHLEEEASDDDAVASVRSTKKLKVVIVDTDNYDEDNSKADDGTSSEEDPMEPMRDPIKRKLLLIRLLFPRQLQLKQPNSR